MSVSLLTALLVLLGAVSFIAIIVLLICEYGFLPQINGKGVVVNKYQTCMESEIVNTPFGRQTRAANIRWFLDIKVSRGACLYKIANISVPDHLYNDVQKNFEVTVVYVLHRISKNISIKKCYWL